MNEIATTGRGSGRTTRQLASAPQGAVYVTLNAHAQHYTERLARALGRTDLVIVPRSWVSRSCCLLVWQSCYSPADVLIDHALELTEDERVGYERIQRVRRSHSRRRAISPHLLIVDEISAIPEITWDQLTRQLFSPVPRHCADCKTELTEHYFTSKKTGAHVCQTCFDNKADSGYAREAGQPLRTRTKKPHPLDVIQGLAEDV